MIRRDFLKLLGLCGAAIALPVSVMQADKLTGEMPPEIHELVRKGQGVLLDFHFEDRSFFVYAEEGNFTWQEFRSPEFRIERGCLEPVSESSELIAFSLDAQVSWTNESDFIGHIRSHMPEFNMDVVMGDDEHLTLQGCLWETLEYDMSQGTFFITGRSKYITVIK